MDRIPPRPASVTINAGQTQIGPASQALATQLSVIVRDASSNPLANVAVTWAAASGGGSVSPTTNTTNASGIAATTRTLGANAGAHTTTATVAGLTPVTFNAVAQIQGAIQIAIGSVGRTFGTAGTFNYQCINHPTTMTGTVTVSPQGMLSDQRSTIN